MIGLKYEIYIFSLSGEIRIKDMRLTFSFTECFPLFSLEPDFIIVLKDSLLHCLFGFLKNLPKRLLIFPYLEGFVMFIILHFYFFQPYLKMVNRLSYFVSTLYFEK